MLEIAVCKPDSNVFYALARMACFGVRMSIFSSCTGVQSGCLCNVYCWPIWKQVELVQEHGVTISVKTGCRYQVCGIECT